MAFSHYLLFLIPLGLSLAITPLVIAFARRVGAMDQPNERKVHTNPIPRLGGVAIYASFFLAVFVTLSLDTGIEAFAGMAPRSGVMLVVSLTLVLFLGVWDDLYQLSPGRKFLGQLLAGTIVYLAGFRISAITHPFGTELLSLGFWDFPATLLWVVGITNAINLIDGLDGLAGGVAMIVALTMAAVASLKGDATTALMALLLAGSILGFLRYNFNGAKIFLGDSGSLFLGFTLAILSIRSSTKGTTAFSIIIPMLALGLPIMDTLLSMTRRFLRSVLPQQQTSRGVLGKLLGMFLPDRGHIHHRLIDRGLSHRNVVLVLYVVSCFFGLGAFAVTVLNDVGASVVLFTIGAATFIGVSQLRYKEMAVLRNGVLLPMYDRPLMNSSLFHGFLDIAFMVVAYVAAHWLSFRGEATHGFDRPFLVTLAAVGGGQLLVFSLAGMYRGTFRQMGIGDLLKILKTVTLAVGVTFGLLAVIPNQLHHISLALAVLDFYVLLSLVVGARISYLVLHYLSQREVRRGGKQVLIYGSCAQGLLIQQRMISDASLDANPVGFLDDDPSMEGKRLNGIPVYGGHWRLQRLINTMKIDEVLIACDAVNPEVLQRLSSVTRANGVALRTLRLQLEEVQGPPRTPAPKVPLGDDILFAPK